MADAPLRQPVVTAQTTRAGRAHGLSGLLLFIGVTFAGSGALVATFWMLGGHPGGPEARALAVLYGLVPGFAALVVQGPLRKAALRDPLGLKAPQGLWLLLSWLMPLGILVVAIALGYALLDVRILTTAEAYIAHHSATVAPEEFEAFARQMRGSGNPLIRFVLQALVFGGSFNAALALGEELGWRGLLFSELRPYGPVRRATITGCLWGLWLLPFAWMARWHPDHLVAGSVLVWVWAMLLSPLLDVLRSKASSVLAPAVFRGTTMALSGTTGLFAVGGTDLTVGPTSLTVLVAVVLTLTALALIRLARCSSQRRSHAR